ncbi:MAG TPA: histidine phosphatase family protein [Candidatus Eisenbacteria bacterium]|nr:histidine phosphatase family protein [Candidatus Eisenbacteria bacterium]
MTATFEFRRHSIKDGPTSAMIGPKGYALARQIGAQQLRGRKFDAFFASGYWRTHQTLAAFAEGAGDFMLKITPPTPPLYIERDEIWDLWRVCRKAELAGEDMVNAALMHDTALFNGLGREYADLFMAWAATFHAGDRVLVVGHSPHMEIMACGLSGVIMPGLKECEGFRFTPDDVPVIEHGSPDLDPAAIRAAAFP